jgi:hypothetical protein
VPGDSVGSSQGHRTECQGHTILVDLNNADDSEQVDEMWATHDGTSCKNAAMDELCFLRVGKAIKECFAF